jgi:hypothetical protein
MQLELLFSVLRIIREKQEAALALSRRWVLEHITPIRLRMPVIIIL